MLVGFHENFADIPGSWAPLEQLDMVEIGCYSNDLEVRSGQDNSNAADSPGDIVYIENMSVPSKEARRRPDTYG
jgi:hypothetical protein